MLLLVCCERAPPPSAQIRFAPSSQLLAAGTDDSEGLVYELREGRGSAVFGSGESANIENWRLRIKLRGHAVRQSAAAAEGLGCAEVLGICAVHLPMHGSLLRPWHTGYRQAQPLSPTHHVCTICTNARELKPNTPGHHAE